MFSMGSCPCSSHMKSEQGPRTSKHEKRGYLAVTSLALTGNTLLAQLGRSQIQRTAVSDWVTCHRHVTLQASPLAGDGGYIAKKETVLGQSLSNRQLPILPARLQASTFGVYVLNYCVRNGNRWSHTAIITGLCCCIHLHVHTKLYRNKS